MPCVETFGGTGPRRDLHMTDAERRFRRLKLDRSVRNHHQERSGGQIPDDGEERGDHRFARPAVLVCMSNRPPQRIGDLRSVGGRRAELCRNVLHDIPLSLQRRGGHSIWDAIG